MTDSLGQIIGIDLGTTFSAMAQLDRGGRPVTLPNAEGELITASVVLFDIDGTVVVGREARRASLVYPDRVADCVKRDMGQAFYHRPVAGKRLPPQSIAAMILRKLRQDAERQLGRPVTGAVITVPAHFDEARRQATVDAGTIAGLEVLDIINEPTSAALAYAFGRLITQGLTGRDAAEAITRQEELRRAMVYDLGGGTFDVTIIETRGTDVRVLATDGAVRLGGKDWDERIVNHAADLFVGRFHGDPRDDPQSHQDLLLTAEEAKKDLSRREVVRFPVNHAGNRLVVELTRGQFQEMTADLLYRTESRVDRVIRQVGLAWSEIDEILLVGGSTRMPQVRKMLGGLAGREPNSSLSADEVVAHGAAIHAAILQVDPQRLVHAADVVLLAEAQSEEVITLPAGSDEPIELAPAPQVPLPSGAPVAQDSAAAMEAAAPLIEMDDTEKLAVLEAVPLEPATEAPPAGLDAPGEAPVLELSPEPVAEIPELTLEPVLLEDSRSGPITLDSLDLSPAEPSDACVTLEGVEQDQTEGPLEIEEGPPPLPQEAEEAVSRRAGTAAPDALVPSSPPAASPEPGGFLEDLPAPQSQAEVAHLSLDSGAQDAAPMPETPGEIEPQPPMPQEASAPAAPQTPSAPESRRAGTAPEPIAQAEAPPAPQPPPAPAFQEDVVQVLQQFNTINVNAHSLGVIVWSPTARQERINVLIPRNTPLPASQRRTYGTVSENQRLVRVRVTEGESDDPDGCVTIGECVASPLPPGLPVGSPISVTFTYDNSGRLHVRAKDETSGLTAKCTIVRSGAMDRDTLERSRRAVSDMTIT